MRTILISLLVMITHVLTAQEKAENPLVTNELDDSIKFHSVRTAIPGYNPDFSTINLFTFNKSVYPIETEINNHLFKEIRMSAHIPVYYSDYLYSNIYGSFSIDENSWINTTRTNDFYYGFGMRSTASATYNYKLGDFGVFTAGAYLTKYNINYDFYNGAGFNGNLKIPLGERISIHAFGQYSLTDNKNLNLYQGMYPTTNFGGSVELKVTDKFGINAGMVREWMFDPLRGGFRWVNRPFFMPVFY